jgi:hypothetical protein
MRHLAFYRTDAIQELSSTTNDSTSRLATCNLMPFCCDPVPGIDGDLGPAGAINHLCRGNLHSTDLELD